MGKRLQLERPTTDRSARKRKRSAVKAAEKRQRLSGGSSSANGFEFHENDDEESCSSAGSAAGTEADPPTLLHTPHPRSLLLTGASIASDHNNSSVMESPRPVYTLRPSVVNGTILRDVLSKAWRLGRPIGKGNFGEIFLASDDTVCPASSETAKYVVKIEPHSNGPLFVEIHCLINTSQNKDLTDVAEDAASLPAPQTHALSRGPPSGIPSFIASGTHYFGDVRYRFLVLPRFDRDLHSLIKNSRVQQKSLLVLAVHIIDVLENLHDKGYCHNDIKAQNLMVSKCKYLRRQAVPKGNGYEDHYEEKQQTTDSGNSSEQETNDDDYFLKSEKFALKKIVDIKQDEDEDDEDFDDGATSNSNNSNSVDIFQTPVNKKRSTRNPVQFSGSNPVRSCRREKRNSMYEEMVKSHYLRPTKRISYREEFNEDGYPKDTAENSDESPESSDNESDEFIPPSSRRSASKRGKGTQIATPKKCPVSTRATRHQEKVKKEPNGDQKSRSRGSKHLDNNPSEYKFLPTEEEHVFLIDFGLASKFQDRGVHRPFIMDQRRAHDGTLEFTSRDAHLGAHSRRSDLECLGYNLLYWSEGYLPWKDVAQQQQQEKVHRAKELFMTDVPEMLRQFYGKQVPKYLGEFLLQIGQLAYQERPNYERYRKIFKREYQRLGYDPSQMRLSSDEILRTCVSAKDVVDGSKCDIFELNNKAAANVMRNSTLSTPFQEHSLTNRVSPKNLRSKSNKKTTKKKFSWAEVLSQDPDQIARERAVKEFEREETICPLESRLPRRYEGKPTYAILDMEQRRREKGLVVQEHNEEEEEEEEEEEDDEEENQEAVDDEQKDDEAADSVEGEDESDRAMEESDYSDNSQKHARGRTKATTRKRTTNRQTQSQQNQPSTKVHRGGSRPSKNLGVVKFAAGAISKNRSTPLSAVASNKRGCATRKENSTLASATGEVERKLKTTRTRRALYKTEPKHGEHDVENNSSLLLVQNLYGEYDDENNYGKGRSVHSSRHCRK
ncbi:eukaryotic translation initiation factor 5B isoform X1 [Drosophila erecta]|uniref:non-specific serine/threonine protein kinase n=1 Tax=Drosophila erecta TaxID=7220 RepID=B3NS81_DROER|nr:eukaryotic translation initiation factor 5B isoform X1 [Drosophila erecta]XP_015012522.1 eukaryotic translation initiation factor 5B isoform X1 [Drosophila erecta]XP_026836685.1 eukaryotic translation initiation factor 5B isoform X1 [Drosophila erecta]XP_026836686.1 eukaryotic translation initiation factor 5B isoform X1 [Drosophila erecta]XP_026836687.1 eukaryotic translation initiation factor 5B isoform X1 [Drosophila erecta]XP_026836688.1 eukaryotic translation initiation factor 5B isofor